MLSVFLTLVKLSAIHRLAQPRNDWPWAEAPKLSVPFTGLSDNNSTKMVYSHKPSLQRSHTYKSSCYLSRTGSQYHDEGSRNQVALATFQQPAAALKCSSASPLAIPQPPPQYLLPPTTAMEAGPVASQTPVQLARLEPVAHQPQPAIPALTTGPAPPGLPETQR